MPVRRGREDSIFPGAESRGCEGERGREYLDFWERLAVGGWRLMVGVRDCFLGDNVTGPVASGQC